MRIWAMEEIVRLVERGAKDAKVLYVPPPLERADLNPPPPAPAASIPVEVPPPLPHAPSSSEENPVRTEDHLDVAEAEGEDAARSGACLS